MKFNVLNDGTILSANGVQVGTIDITNEKYRDDIIEAIESPYPVGLIDDIYNILPKIEYDSTDMVKIDKTLGNISEHDKNNILHDIISLINYYK